MPSPAAPHEILDLRRPKTKRGWQVPISLPTRQLPALAEETGNLKSKISKKGGSTPAPSPTAISG
jgi:hypothetical protein